MKINMKNRYAVGWSDMRGTFGNSAYDDQEIKMNLSRNTNLEEVPTEVLRNLWLVKFGGRAVSMADMHNHRFDDIADVGQELANRKQIRCESIERPDIMERLNYYILEDEDADH